jgi:hypothetical protein
VRYLAIDPSVNNVGIAFYDDVTDKLKTHTFNPLREGRNTTNIAIQILRFLHVTVLQGEKRPDYLVMEHPQWENSDRGHKAAARGYTLDLAYLIGFIGGSVGLAGSKIYTPTPLEWKGNRPKTAVGYAFEKRFSVPAKSVTDHEFEAAMMIDWLIEDVLTKG